MKKVNLLLIGLVLTTQLIAQGGADLFNSNCSACHTIGKGQLVGPDLKGTHKKYDEKWLIKWIKSSQSMVNAGDKKAVELFNKFNQIPMPDNSHLSDADIKSLIAYVKVQSGDVDVPAGAEKTSAPNESASTEVAASAEAPTSATSPSAVSTQTVENTPVESSSTSSSGSTYIYWILGCVILFLIVLLLILTKTMYVLIDEIKNIYKEKNEKGE